MILPPAIASRIQACVDGIGSLQFPIDDEARKHGAIALMGSFGEIWGLRPDGTFWRFDEEFGLDPQPLPDNAHVRALSWGRLRYPWIEELIPIRPAGAIDCADCNGRGNFSNFPVCPTCSGTGWLGPDAVV